MTVERYGKKCGKCSGCEAEAACEKPITWRYRTSYYDPQTRKRKWLTKGGFTTEKAAKSAERKAITSIENQDVVDPTRVTVGEYLAEFMTGVETSRDITTVESYKWEVVYVNRYLKDIRLQSLHPAEIEDMFRELLLRGKRCRRCPGCRETYKKVKKADRLKMVEPPPEKEYVPCSEPLPLSPHTVQGVHRFFNTALIHAVKRGYLVKNPLDTVGRPFAEEVEKVVWTPERAKLFLELAMKDRLFACWVLVLSTGMRRGELAGLHWENVDLERGTLYVTTQRTTAGYLVVDKRPKSKKSRRILTLNDRTLAALKAWKLKQAEERADFGDAWEDNGLVFTWPDGKAIHPQRFREFAQRLMTAAGVPVIALHNLRHTVATMLLAAGVHPKVVQELLGHSTIQMTLDMYSQVPQEIMRDATTTLGKMLEEPVEPPKALESGIIDVEPDDLAS